MAAPAGNFTDAEQLAMVLEAEAPDATVGAVARADPIVRRMLLHWRVQFGYRKPEPAGLPGCVSP